MVSITDGDTLPLFLPSHLSVWHAEKTSVCRFKTSPCVPAPRPHVYMLFCDTPQESGRSELDQTPDKQWYGRLACRCQWLICETENHGRCLCLVPVIFCAQDGSGRTRDLCAKHLTEHSRGNSSATTFKADQARRRKRGGLQSPSLFWEFVGSNKCAERTLRPQKS